MALFWQGANLSQFFEQTMELPPKMSSPTLVIKRIKVLYFH
jgi:hypothetical protein